MRHYSLLCSVLILFVLAACSSPESPAGKKTGKATPAPTPKTVSQMPSAVPKVTPAGAKGTPAAPKDETALMEETLITRIEKAKTVFDLYDLEKDPEFAKADSSRAKASLDGKRKRLLSEKTTKPLLDGIHFVDFQFKRQKAAKKELPDYYKVSVVFWAEKQPEKDYAVQWHGHVDEEHAKLLPQLLDKNVPFSGNNVMWSFPGPKKADWNKGDYILVTAGVGWPDLPYELFLALAPYDGGTCSLFINLGWAADLGK